MGVQLITIVGNVGKAVEMKYGADGGAISNFSVAVNEKSKAGEETTWYRCSAFQRTAEVAKEYLASGSQVLVIGRLRARTYQDKQGLTQTSLDVNVQTLQLLGAKGEGPPKQQIEDDSDLPF